MTWLETRSDPWAGAPGELVRRWKLRHEVRFEGLGLGTRVADPTDRSGPIQLVNRCSTRDKGVLKAVLGREGELWRGSLALSLTCTKTVRVCAHNHVAVPVVSNSPQGLVE